MRLWPLNVSMVIYRENNARKSLSLTFEGMSISNGWNHLRTISNHSEFEWIRVRWNRNNFRNIFNDCDCWSDLHCVLVSVTCFQMYIKCLQLKCSIIVSGHVQPIIRYIWNYCCCYKISHQVSYTKHHLILLESTSIQKIHNNNQYQVWPHKAPFTT